jgi:hypothetical protein
MPIPAPERYRRSNLTKEQQQEQLSALYGVPMAQQFSEVDIANMRRALAEHDSQAKPVTIHDLNNPPREPYKFQKFPMMVYDHANSFPATEQEEPSKTGFGMITVHVRANIASRTVQSEEELQAALADGWSEHAPEFRDEYSEFASGATKYNRDAAKVQAKLDKANEEADLAAERRRAGRPTNAEREARRAAQQV